MDRGYAGLEVGAEYRSYARTITETDLVNFTCFAGLRLPIFVDAEFARRHSPFGGRIVPGFLTCSVIGGMMEAVLGRSTVAALGIDRIRFPRPVQPGDTIHARISVIDKRDLEDGERGLVTLSVRGFNQRDEEVVLFDTRVILRKSPPE